MLFSSALDNDGIVANKVELLVVDHGELDVSRDDPLLLLLDGDVATHFNDFLSEVFDATGHVNGGLLANSLVEAVSSHHAHEPGRRKNDICSRAGGHFGGLDNLGSHFLGC